MIHDRSGSLPYFREAVAYARNYDEWRTSNHKAAAINSLWGAYTAIREALYRANRNGWPAKTKAPIFRVMNWIRVELRRVGE